MAEVLFTELDVDAYFLEYDDERSGDFAPLRFVPSNKTVVLGLITSKRPSSNRSTSCRRESVRARSNVPMEQLCLSPQCGFSAPSRQRADRRPTVGEDVARGGFGRAHLVLSEPVIHLRRGRPGSGRPGLPPALWPRPRPIGGPLSDIVARFAASRPHRPARVRHARIASTVAAPVMNTNGTPTTRRATTKAAIQLDGASARDDGRPPAQASARRSREQRRAVLLTAMLDEPPERTVISAISVDARSDTRWRSWPCTERVGRPARRQRRCGSGRVPRCHRPTQGEPSGEACADVGPVRAEALQCANRAATAGCGMTTAPIAARWPPQRWRQPLGGAQAEGGGPRVLQEGAPDRRGPSMVARQVAQPQVERREVDLQRADAIADLQLERVSTRSAWSIRVAVQRGRRRWRQRRAKLRAQRQHRRAPANPAKTWSASRSPRCRPGRSRRRVLRRRRPRRHRPAPARLDVEQRPHVRSRREAGRHRRRAEPGSTLALAAFIDRGRRSRRRPGTMSKVYTGTSPLARRERGDQGAPAVARHRRQDQSFASW